MSWYHDDSLFFSLFVPFKRFPVLSVFRRFFANFTNYSNAVAQNTVLLIRKVILSSYKNDDSSIETKLNS